MCATAQRMLFCQSRGPTCARNTTVGGNESPLLARPRMRSGPTKALVPRPSMSPADAKMEPKEVRSTVLTPDEEAIVVAFRRHTLLPL